MEEDKILKEIYFKLLVVHFDTQENVEHVVLEKSMNEILELIEEHNR